LLGTKKAKKAKIKLQKKEKHPCNYEKTPETIRHGEFGHYRLEGKKKTGKGGEKAMTTKKGKKGKRPCHHEGGDS